MKTIFACILIFTTIGLSGQGITSSGGYITNSGTPYIVINDGSLVNNGTWTKASEIVTFTGTIAGELKGSASDYHNLVISNTGGITLNTINLTTCDNLTINASGIYTIAPTSKLTVNTTLTNNGGNGGLIIKSTVNGSGSLISTSSASATVEQYHTDSTYIYHMVSMPVTSGTAAVYKFNGVQTYVYSYNPATPAWVNITTSATALNVGKGYLVNYHNVAVDRTSTYSGTLNANNVSPSLSATTAKFNLVGNPYPCAIDWNGAGWTKTGISSTYYVWLPAKGSYGTYTTTGNISVNGLGNIIQSGQGFFVYSSLASPVLTIANAAKTHNTNRLKSEDISPPLIKLHISNDANTFTDEAVIVFTTDATTGYEANLDAIKMLTLSTESSQIYTATDSMKLVINALPLNYKDSIPVFFKCKKEATYTLELTDNTYGDSIILTDLLTNKTDLLSANKYIFTALKTDTSRRFVLNKKKTETSVTGLDVVKNEVNEVLIYSDGTRAYVVNKTGRELDGELYINNITGKMLLNKNIHLITEYNTDLFYPGVYIVSFYSENKLYRGKIVIF